MAEVGPFLDVSPQNSWLKIMIFATPLVASIKTYEGVKFQSKLIKATILTCFSAIRIDINHVYSFKTVARKTSGATGAAGG